MNILHYNHPTFGVFLLKPILTNQEQQECDQQINKSLQGNYQNILQSIEKWKTQEYQIQSAQELKTQIDTLRIQTYLKQLIQEYPYPYDHNTLQNSELCWSLWNYILSPQQTKRSLSIPIYKKPTFQFIKTNPGAI